MYIVLLYTVLVYIIENLYFIILMYIGLTPKYG